MNVSPFPLSTLIQFVFLPSPFFSTYCCSNSCPAITTQQTPLISLPSFLPSHPSSLISLPSPHSFSLLFLHFLSHGLTISVHPHKWVPHHLQDTQILLFGNLVILLPLVLWFGWCPRALGKVCGPGWILACVVLISPEWSLHHYWGWFYCLCNFTTMPLAALTPVTWSLSPQQLLKEVW